MKERQNYLGILIHKEEPTYLSKLGRMLLQDHYLKENETPQEGFARTATNFCYGDYELAQRIYDYAYNGDFMFASPIFSSAVEGKWNRSDEKREGWIEHKFEAFDKPSGLPISCFGMYIPDTRDGQVAAMEEAAVLTLSGGGVGLHNGIRGTSDKAPGPIPYMKVMDSVVGYYKQKGTRRGTFAYGMQVDHPDIMEHIRFRVPGGDPQRRSDNRPQFHCTVNITDEFKQAVLEDKEIELRCPHTKRVYETVRGRDLWEEIGETRALTGGPFLCKIDAANRNLPDSQKLLELSVKGSNICVEILLPTNEERTFVCCLSSLNLERYDKWKDTSLVADLVKFLDNVLQWFIDNAPSSLSKAVFSAKRERAIGIGTLGWHSYLQSKMISFESGGFNSATQMTNIIYRDITSKAVEASRKLALERGEAPDMEGSGMRNSKLFAIAPNANSADLANTSPSIEPWYRNIFVKDTRVGSVVIKNKYLEELLESKGYNTKEIWKKIEDAEGSVQGLDTLTQEEKAVFKNAMEMDQHWLVEHAETRGRIFGKYGQAQSLNLFFPAGTDRAYLNSVHLKWLKSDNVYTLYYHRTEKESKVDKVKDIERDALVDWSGDECIACSG